MLRKQVILAAVALSLIGTPAHADLQLVESDAKSVGATTITWDSSLEDVAYEVGTEILIEANWAVDEGVGRFVDFDLRSPEFTPKGPDPAEGELLDVALIQDSGGAGRSGRVEVLFVFTDLHCEAELELGNAHFSLFLDIDADGDGRADSEVSYGVNVHVEEPGRC